VWAALLNLENTYGSPPEAAAMAAFQRASAHVDPKRLHLAAAAMFARSGRAEAARALLKAACRKFGGSAKARENPEGPCRRVDLLLRACWPHGPRASSAWRRTGQRVTRSAMLQASCSAMPCLLVQAACPAHHHRVGAAQAALQCWGLHTLNRPISAPALSELCRPLPAQVWLQAAALELGEGGGGSGAAQKLLDRALNTLPSRKHIKVSAPHQGPCKAGWSK
jgi:hypothetical protein